MSDKTKIEWADASWTPIRARFLEIQDDGSGKERIGWHCEHVSEGCRHCYAEGINRRLGTGLDFKPGHLYREDREGYANGEVKLFLDERMLTQPLRWRKPRMIFVCSMTDLFADFVPDGWIMSILDVIFRTPQHTYQILTKRPQRMRDFMRRWGDLSGEDFDPKLVRGPDETRAAHPSGRGQLFASYLDALLEMAGGDVPDGAAWPTFDWAGGMIGWPLWPRNAWLGVSVEDQAAADERIPLLLDTPAAVRWISAEPLLGPIDLSAHRVCGECGETPYQLFSNDPLCDDPSAHYGGNRCPLHYWPDDGCDGHLHHKIDWVVVGGESGPGARPMHPALARSLRDQCAAAGVPFFFKQWGSWLPGQNDIYDGFGNKQEVAHWQDGGWGPRDASRPDQNYVMWKPDGTLHRGDLRSTAEYFRPAAWAQRVGKKAAGRLLDGVEHNGYPS